MKFQVSLLLSTFAGAIAFAEAPAPAVPGMGAQGGLTPFIPLILIFGIFYFLIIRPQQKKAKEHGKFLSDLKKGDMVVTNAGIIGTIKQLGDKFVTLEIDEGVFMKMLRSQVLESANTLKEEAKPKTV